MSLKWSSPAGVQGVGDLSTGHRGVWLCPSGSPRWHPCPPRQQVSVFCRRAWTHTRFEFSRQPGCPGASHQAQAVPVVTDVSPGCGPGQVSTVQASSPSWDSALSASWSQQCHTPHWRPSGTPQWRPRPGPCCRLHTCRNPFSCLLPTLRLRTAGPARSVSSGPAAAHRGTRPLRG